MRDLYSTIARIMVAIIIAGEDSYHHVEDNV
jgi:hypothetical protein